MTMMPIRQILVPLDFPDLETHSRRPRLWTGASMEALRRAIDLARPFKATLTLVHVIDFPGYVYSAVPFADVDLFAQFESAARAQLDEAFRRVSLEYPHARAVMRPHWGQGRACRDPIGHR
jgi:nucleotide-binding universal stress UspA family protein